MLQNFLDWIQIKFRIHNQKNPPSFKEREVWWANLGQNIGDEENGKGQNFMRPVVIIKKFNRNLALVVPTSTRIKESLYYVTIQYNGKSYSALTSQIRTIDAKRLQNKIITLDKEEFFKINHSIIGYLPKN